MADAGASDAGASAAPVLPLPAPPAPLGLPSKLKERWNAAYDPSAPGRAVIENKHTTDVESSPPHPYTPRVCTSIYPVSELCSDLGRVLLLNDRPTLNLLSLNSKLCTYVFAFTLKVNHASISVNYLFSMTLMPGAAKRARKEASAAKGKVAVDAAKAKAAAAAAATAPAPFASPLQAGAYTRSRFSST